MVVSKQPLRLLVLPKVAGSGLHLPLLNLPDGVGNEQPLDPLVFHKMVGREQHLPLILPRIVRSEQYLTLLVLTAVVGTEQHLHAWVSMVHLRHARIPLLRLKYPAPSLS